VKKSKWQIEREKQDAEAEAKGRAVAFTLLVVVAVLMVVGSLVEAQWKYGDWRCAYRRCVVVVQPEGKP
jgi:hypothetical protein